VGATTGAIDLLLENGPDTLITDSDSGLGPIGYGNLKSKRDDIVNFV